jgi:hypothetical protein
MKQFDVKPLEKEEGTVETKEGPGWLPYFLGLVLGLVLSFGTMYLFWGKEKSTPVSESSSPQVINELSENQKQNQEQNVSENTSAPLPPPPTETSSSEQKEVTPTFQKAQVKIQLLNGNGVKGDAARVKNLLTQAGWNVVAYGNANSFNYQNTLIYYKIEQEEAAKALADVLKNAGRHTALHQSTNLVKYDIQVILGKQ